MEAKPNIAIDGPAGAGKSTVARMVAERLGLLYIDTGAMYRAVALQALRLGLDPEDRVAMGQLVEQVNISLVNIAGEGIRVLLNNENVTEEVRDPDVTRIVSLVASVPAVRKRLVELQRAMARRGGVVMEGRDIGTVVLPDARVKIFLTASPAERARRRREELAAKGFFVGQNQMEEEIAKRDRIDSHRETDPLLPAIDAEIIDSSSSSVEQVVKMIVDRANLPVAGTC